MPTVFPEPYVTAQMVIDAPADGRRYEVVWGELLVTSTVTPEHQHLIGEILFPLSRYCERFHVGEAMLGPADITWSEDTLVKPDVFVMTLDEAKQNDWAFVKTLPLVAEILGPETAKQDRFQKRKLYQMRRVETLWLVDPSARAVEVWSPDTIFPIIERDRLTWHPAGAAEPLVILVPEVFA